MSRENYEFHNQIFQKRLFLDHEEKYVFLVAFVTALDWFTEVPEQA